MSMPSFPPNGADMTREEALTMIIASIAMEELALSHILNAEGEKLQYILGTLPGSHPCACPRDVLDVNKSVTALVEMVTQNQMLLKNKLSQVLEFCPPPSLPECRPDPGPCPPPCRPEPCEFPCGEPCRTPVCEKSAIQLVGQKERMQWNSDCRLLWKLRCRKGDSICWEGRAPGQIQIDPGRSYAVQYTLNVCALSPSEGTIQLKQSPGGVFTDTLSLRFSVEGSRKTLHYSAVIHPCKGSCCGTELSLVLDADAPICVERAVLDVVEL